LPHFWPSRLFFLPGGNFQPGWHIGSFCRQLKLISRD
jgi:hypothetical protein